MNNIENQKLICRYAKGGSGVDVEGSSSAFKEFAELLSGTGISYEFFVPKGPATPYDYYLGKFIVEEKEGKLKIYPKERTLICSGEKRYLKDLLKNILFFAQQEFTKGMHSHEEYYEDHFYLDSEAEAIVFSRTS